MQLSLLVADEEETGYNSGLKQGLNNLRFDNICYNIGHF